MNSANRSTTALNPIAALMILDAADYSFSNGTPFNRFISINLSLMDVGASPQVYANRFLKYAGDWLRTQDERLFFVFVVENPSGWKLNLHILVHIPDKLLPAFRKLERKWACRAARKKKLPAKFYRTRRVGRITEISGKFLAHLERTVKYVLKGADRASCETLGIDHKPQGTVDGKRYGISHSLSWACRTKVTFVAQIAGQPSSPFVARRTYLLRDWDKDQLAGALYKNRRYRLRAPLAGETDIGWAPCPVGRDFAA